MWHVKLGRANIGRCMLNAFLPPVPRKLDSIHFGLIELDLTTVKLDGMIQDGIKAEASSWINFYLPRKLVLVALHLIQFELIELNLTTV